MKKLLLILMGLFTLSGCTNNNDSVVKSFEEKINSLESYHLIGDLTIFSDEDKYNYNVDVTYKKGDYYRVSLINKDNSHEQIILKNEEGVYVITPSLNKSFKFQSDWPSNSSQSYILSTIVKDVVNDENRSVVKKNDLYEITSSVNYINNTDLKTQTIVLDSEYLPKEIIIKNKDNINSIITKITKIDTKTKYNNEYFSLSNNIKNNEVKEENVSSIIDDIVYPMYLPSGTTYSKEEVVSTTDGERIILTYTGVKPFILIEENSKRNDEHQTTKVSGDVVMYNNVLGVMSSNSLNWNENGREYYLISEDMSSEELLKIASSTNLVAIVK